MSLSREANSLRKLIENAINDQQITRDEYEQIVHMATEDGYIDPQERELLRQLREMIEDKTIKLVK
jgi:MFS superfamily sulfate permease-like transporter